MKKIFGKKIVLRLVASAAVAVIFASGFSIPAQADAKTYKVIIRAGEHGEFLVGDVVASEESSKKLVFEVEEGGSLTVQSTAAIVDIVNAQYQGKYFVQDEYLNFQNITRNEEYVIQYGRLVDGVEYKVEYVDNATGVPIADPKFAWGNDGAATPATYAKSISNYALASGSPQTLMLDKNAAFNTITFRYNSTLTGGTTTNTTYQTADGGTETINETQQNPIYQAVPGAAPVAAVATTGGTGGAGTTVIGEEETALEATTPEADTEDEAIQGDTDAAEDTQDTEEATIEEEEVALAPNANQPVNVAAVAAVMLGGIAVILAVIWIIARRRTAGIDDQNDSDQNHKNE